jgi:hypothetical protein
MEVEMNPKALVPPDVRAVVATSRRTEETTNRNRIDSVAESGE